MNLFPRHLPLPLRCVLATLIVAACMGVRLALFGTDGHSPYLPLFAAVVVSGVVFDVWTGLFAALLGAVVAIYFFVAPVGSFMIASSFDIMGLAVFLAAAIVAALLVEALRRTARRYGG